MVTKGFSICANGDFLIVGETYSVHGSDASIFLIRTDSLGNLKWKNKYSFVSNGYERLGATIEDSINGNILLCGYRYWNGGTQSVIYFADSSGNVLYDRNYTGPFGGSIVAIEQLNDGSFIAAGHKVTGGNVGASTLLKPFLVRFQNNGDLIWANEYGQESILAQFSDIEILGGDTFIAGGTQDTLLIDSLGFNSNFLVCKIASDGSVIWKRNIDIYGQWATEDWVKGICQTPDSGFALTGFVLNGNSTREFILVKLDKYGCETAGCQFVSVPEQEIAVTFEIFPNPSRERLVLRLNNFNTKSTSIELWDSLGRKVKSLKAEGVESSIEVSDLGPGLYIVSVSDINGVLGQQKLIISR